MPGGPLPMKSSSQAKSRRNGVTAVHSLDRFAFTVPDLDEAQRFYSEFGLDARREGQRLDLYTLGHSHRWGSIFAAPGRKKLQYLRFGVYAEDFESVVQRSEQTDAPRV